MTAAKRRNFTVLELLFTVTIVAILIALLLPGLSQSRQRARFARWLHFNKQCSADPTCVINLNFQDNEDENLVNSAHGFEGEGFNAKRYNGVINGDFEWARGRWVKGKRAIQLDGVSTYIEFPENKFLNFAGENDFTIVVSVKFDNMNKWDGIFGKCYMRNPSNGYPQYALYLNNNNSDGNGNGNGNGNNSDKLFRIDIGETSVLFSKEDENGRPVNLEPDKWVHMVLRNKNANGQQKVDLFLDGVKLKSTYKHYGPGNKEREEANFAIGCIRWKLDEETSSYVCNPFSVRSYVVDVAYTTYNCKVVDQNGGDGNGNNGNSHVNNDQNGDGPGNNGKGKGNGNSGNSGSTDQNGGDGNGNNGNSDVNNDQNGDGPGNNGNGNGGGNNGNGNGNGGSNGNSGNGNGNGNSGNGNGNSGNGNSGGNNGNGSGNCGGNGNSGNGNSGNGNSGNGNSGNGNGNSGNGNSGNGNGNSGNGNSGNGNGNGNNDDNGNGNTERNRKRARKGRPDNFLKGKIDEFIVYNRALTDAEIKAHYEMGAENK